MPDPLGERAAISSFGITAALLMTAAPAWAQPPAKAPAPNGAWLLIALLPLALGAFVALELLLWVLAPAPLEATARAIERARGRSLLLGLAAAAVTLGLLALLGQHPAVGKSAAPLLLGLIALGCLTGITAITALLGRGVIELADRRGSRALAVLWGSVLLGFGVLFPLVGQVLGAYFLLLGLGGALAALFDSPRPRK